MLQVAAVRRRTCRNHILARMDEENKELYVTAKSISPMPREPTILIELVRVRVEEGINTTKRTLCVTNKQDSPRAGMITRCAQRISY